MKASIDNSAWKYGYWRIRDYISERIQELEWEELVVDAEEWLIKIEEEVNIHRGTSSITIFLRDWKILEFPLKKEIDKMMVH